MKRLLLILATFLLIFIIKSEESKTYAQSCSGSVTCCLYRNTERTPEGCSRTCDPTDDDCVRCTGVRLECGRFQTEPCGHQGYFEGCVHSCNGTIESGSCSFIPAAPRPTPTPYRPPPPPPPPPTCTGSQCETTPPPPPDPTYSCDPCTGSCYGSSGGDTIQGCSASCTAYLAGTPACGGPGPGPVIISESSCEELVENSADDLLMPGQTTYWTTWAQPPGSNSTERLQNESPGLITKRYTSPGNMITYALMFRVPEGEPHSIYLYEEETDTWYFFVDIDTPVLIASTSQEIVDIAVQQLGYTLVDPFALSADQARAIKKRVYKLDPDADDPWEDSIGQRVETQIPFAQSYYHIPYISCASVFRASGHSSKFSTMQSNPDPESWNCIRRQPLPYRYPKDDPDDEYTEYIMSGNYLGMEIDWPRSSWRANQGESEGEQVWPRTNLYVGRDLFKYSDELMFSVMTANNQSMNEEGARAPGFVRQAIWQIPIQLFTEELHTLHPRAHIGNVSGSDEPVEDENSDGGACRFDPEDIYIDEGGWCGDEVCPPPTEAPPKCADFKIFDESGRVIPQGGKVKTGGTYTISANFRGEASILNFYNSSFNSPQIGEAGTIDNWRKNGDVNTFEVVDCDNLADGCHQYSTDDRVLKVSRLSGSNFFSSNVQTEEVDAGRNLTGLTLNVEFWARVDGAPRTVAHARIDRVPSYQIRVPYGELGHPSDSRDIKFPNLATVHNIGDTTSSFTVNNEWQKFSGTVTFNYDTTNPTGHPNGNLSSAFHLTLLAPDGGATIYYDDVQITSWQAPAPYFRFVSAQTPAQDATYNQCSTTVTQTGNTRGNLSGAYGEADITIPLNAQPGMHNFFAAMQVRQDPSYTYFGNPNANANCPAANPLNWNDDLANPPLSLEEACMRTVEVVACDENIPQTPSIVSATTQTGLTSTLPNSGVNQFNDMRANDETPRLRIVAQAAGSTAQRSAVTAMTMAIYTYNDNDDEPYALIEGQPAGTNQFSFEQDITSDFTNELTIIIQAFNDNSCVGTGQLASGELRRNIRLMRQRNGYLIEIPKEEYSSYNCRDTRPSLVGKGQDDRIVDITDGTFNTMSMTVNTTNTFNPMNIAYHSDYGEFKFLSYGTVFHNYITDLPYNPPNTDTWRNRITSYTLNLPQNLSEESYVCVENCNPNVGNDISPRCQAAPSATRPYMVIPKPQYPGYPHIEYSNDLNIYVGKGNFNDAWWQARGGLVFSNSNVRSNLPLFNGSPRILCNDQLSADICIPFIAARNLTTPGSTNSHISSGFVITNSSSISNGSSTTPNSWRSQNPGTGGEPVSMSSAVSSSVMTGENFGYYYEQLDLTNTNNLTNQLLPQLNATALNSATIYDSEDDLIVYRRTGSLEINLQDRPINIPADKKVVIFVDGNPASGDRVDIYHPNNADHTNRINVAEGGFFAIISDVDIVFDHTIGHSNHLIRTPAVEGIFMTDRQLIFETKGEDVTDKKFIGEGSFIGLTGVDLQRKYDSDNPFDREKNSAAPVEQFIFSPTLVAATPNFLRQANLTWQETN